MVEKYGFVYIWRDKKHARYYVGCHWGTEDDGYICSSNWMRDAYRRRPEDFKRRIVISGIASTKDTFAEEQRYLDMIKPEELRVRYYNLSTNLKHWITHDKKEIINVKEKLRNAANRQWANTEHVHYMSEINSGVNNPNYGKITSEETRQKLSIALCGREFTEETRRKLSEANIGKTHSDETKGKLSAARQKRDASKRKDALWVSIPDGVTEKELAMIEVKGNEIKFIDLYKLKQNGVSYKLAWQRVKRGWTPLDAITHLTNSERSI